MSEALETLSARRLNLAVLARQHLLEPSSAPLTTVIENIGGLQTQYAPAGDRGPLQPYGESERDDLTRAMEAREVIHGTLMRVTIHSVSAADYWPIVAGDPTFASGLADTHHGSWTQSRARRRRRSGARTAE